MFPKSIRYRIYSVFIIVIFGLFLVILSFSKASLSLTTPFSILYSIFGFLLTSSYLANLIIPIALFSMVSAIIGIVLIYKELKLTRVMKIRRFSQTVLHLGILIALIGALYSSNLTDTYTKEITLGEDMNLSVDGSLKLKFVQTEFDNSSELYVGIINNKYQITKYNNILGEGWIRIALPENRAYERLNDVSIIPTLFEDIYITIIPTSNQDFYTGHVESLKFQVQIKPMIWLLWFGIIVVIISMIPIVIISFIKLKNRYAFSSKMESTLDVMSNNISK
jgi:hypothetical protein